MFDRITAAFTNEPTAMLAPPLLDRDLSVADWTPRGEAHHTEHSIFTLTAKYEDMAQRECGFEYRRSADDSIIDQHVEGVASPCHHPCDEDSKNRPLEEDPWRLV